MCFSISLVSLSLSRLFNVKSVTVNGDVRYMFCGYPSYNHNTYGEYIKAAGPLKIRLCPASCLSKRRNPLTSSMCFAIQTGSNGPR